MRVSSNPRDARGVVVEAPVAAIPRVAADTHQAHARARSGRGRSRAHAPTCGVAQEQRLSLSELRRFVDGQRRRFPGLNRATSNITFARD